MIFYFSNAHCQIKERSQLKARRSGTAYRGSILLLIAILTGLLFLTCALSARSVMAQEAIDIRSESLEYISETNTFIARGSALITFGETTLSADDIRFNEATSDAVAEGNVHYEDPETIINADRIELNLETKLGVIYNSYIFYKKENYHLKGGDLQKLGEKSFFLNLATVTTCNADPPAWHISGKAIKTELNERIEARDASLFIKNVPVLYTPYFWMPLTNKRQSGFLVPSVGSGSTQGFTLKQGFYWAIRQDQDATLYLDYFRYRYAVNPDTFGRSWVYHLRDIDLKRDFLEVQSYHTQRFSGGMTGYLKVHTVNKFDYYDILGSTSSRGSGLPSLNSISLQTIQSSLFDVETSESLKKYLESNLHVSKPFHGGRAYLFGQYRTSLEGSSDAIPQSAPRTGIELYTRPAGPFMYDFSLSGTNFMREDGDQGLRLDVNSNVYISYGRTVNFTQRIGLRETAYFLRDPDKNVNRFLVDVSSVLSTKMLRRYSSFVHVIEPSLEYRYTPEEEDADIPFFDSADIIPHVSSIEYAVTNRIEGQRNTGLRARLRVSQSYNLLNDDRRFSPLVAEGSLHSAPVDFSINTSYDIHDSRLIDSIASLKLRGSKGFLGIGKNFRRSSELDQYTIDAGTVEPIRIHGRSIPLYLYGKLWYDLKGAGVQESRVKTTYRSQCWAVTVVYAKRPDEDQVIFNIELVGLGIFTL
jgi:LPS-assembly protein